MSTDRDLFAITLWQPWASLIMAGFKLYEFRTWKVPAQHIGFPTVMHAGRKVIDDDEWEDLLQPRLDRLTGSTGIDDPYRLDHARCFLLELRERGPIVSAGLGTVTFGTPQRAIDIFRGRMDPDDINPDIWGWPISEVQPFDKPIYTRGYQGLWPWQPEIAAEAAPRPRKAAKAPPAPVQERLL